MCLFVQYSNPCSVNPSSIFLTLEENLSLLPFQLIHCTWLFSSILVLWVLGESLYISWTFVTVHVFTLSTVNVGCLTPFSLQGKSFYLAFATDEEPKCGQWPRLSLVWDPNSAETQLHWTGWNVSGWSELFLIRLLSPEYHTAFFDKHKHFA